MKRLWYPTIALLTIAAAVVGFSMPDSRNLQATPAEEDQVDSAAEMGDIMTTLAKVGDLNLLGTYLRTAGLDSLLSGKGPFTLFAPYDSVLGELVGGDSKGVTRDTIQLRRLLSRHIVKGRAITFEHSGKSRVTTLAGEPLEIVTDNEEVKVDGTVVVEESIWCANGVIHIIDGVIRPTDGQKKDN